VRRRREVTESLRMARVTFSAGNARVLARAPLYALGALVAVLVPRSPRQWVLGSGAGLGEGALVLHDLAHERDPARRLTWLASSRAELDAARARGMRALPQRGPRGRGATRRAGVRLKLSAPKLTPDVKRLGMLILPATFGAGVYQISQFVDTFFATSLEQGSLTLLKYADRLNQMPLGIVGIALGTAILPMLARHIQSGDMREAQRLQTNAVEMATLLTLPAAVALAICAPAFVTAFFVGGKMTVANGAVMSNIVIALVAGLPSYVLVKVFQPGFFSREDTRTPVWIAAAVLFINIGVNFYVVPRYGIVGLAAATAFTSTINVVALYTILQMRGWFHFTWKLAGRIARQIVATIAMGAVLWLLMPLMADRYGGNVIERVWSLAVLCGAGMIVFFAVAWAIGALDKDLIAQLRRRRPAKKPVDLSE